MMNQRPDWLIELDLLLERVPRGCKPDVAQMTREEKRGVWMLLGRLDREARKARE